MIIDTLGWPQIAALLLLAQRGLEELYSQRNTSRLLSAGAREIGRSYYPVVATTHLAWIAAIFFLIAPNAEIHISLAILYGILQIIRYWVIGSLGRYWTHRIITLDNAPVIDRGPYRLIRHPNYAVTIAETFLLPIVFDQLALGVIIGAIWYSVLIYKIELEEQGLVDRRRQSRMGGGQTPIARLSAPVRSHPRTVRLS
ncbi:isoprenylcysteine carboxyl methyltransferase family protein [Hyphomicrobium sp. MC8b]|jgi:methyltransferase|uniref:isoprenylcysteine carboxyl methyltransferase family protein n=1 Tax=unclassified Hyphomicrobium TaxID=2619925 RepID=UPI00391D2A02